MSDYSVAFLRAATHAMIYEVGPWFNASDSETQLGLIGTAPQRRKVGYVNDPDDAGGETKFGVAKNENPTLNVTGLTWAQALDAYYTTYWMKGGCYLLSPRVATFLFDSCVNHGTTRGGKFLQAAVGATQDGVVGPGTAAKANAMNEYDVCRLMADQREQFYRAVVANNPSQAKYLAGWLSRLNQMRDYVRGPMP